MRYDTTNVVDSSIYMKAKLDNNMVGTNYYIENLQDKRNADWDYRYNVVEIEEELVKQVRYTNEEPLFTPVEAVITNVKNPKGKDLSGDYAQLAFKNLKHPCKIGSQYRFDLDFPDMKKMTEEEKHYSTSVWLATNKAPIKAGNSVIVERCNASFAMVGAPNGDLHDIEEVRYVSCVLLNQMKYLQEYANNVAIVPQAEWYGMMQCNYFTNQVKINDRFLFGPMSGTPQAFVVKAVIKSTLDHTFVKDYEDEIESTGLITLAFDKTALDPEDNFETRIPALCPVYKTKDYSMDPQIHASGEELSDPDDPNSPKTLIEVEDETGQKVYAVNFEDFADTKHLVLQGETESYALGLFMNNEQYETEFTITTKLDPPLASAEEESKYYTFEQDRNSFKITNKKPYKRGELIVTATTSIEVDGETKDISRDYGIKLGGFY